MSIAGSGRSRTAHRETPGARGRAKARPALLELVALALLGCTTVIGIDGNYVEGPATAQGTGGKATATGGSGGASADAGEGGATGTGGGGGSESGGSDTGGGGGTVAGCGATQTPCPDGQKCCTGTNGVDTACALPDPSVGCSLTNCERCPPPPVNGVAVCNGDQCDIQCNQDYVRTGVQCDPVGAGGGGGQTGAGGRPACDPKKCPLPGGKACTILSPLNCCKSDGTCGCSWATTGTMSAYCL